MSTKQELLYTVPIEDLRAKDTIKFGAKNANLGEMQSIGLPVPGGFAISADAYEEFIEFNTGLQKKIDNELFNLDLNNEQQLKETGARIRKLIINAEIPEKLRKTIKDAHTKAVEKIGKKKVYFAIRSSGTAEDLPGASFAGQYDTYLNIIGEDEVIVNVRKCWASMYTDRGIDYRGRLEKKVNAFRKNPKKLRELFKQKKVMKVLMEDLPFKEQPAEEICKEFGLDPNEKISPSRKFINSLLDKAYKICTNIALSVGVQQMVKAEASGVMFTIDPDSGNDKVIKINSTHGLGEYLVQGTITPDSFFASKVHNLDIVGKDLETKKQKLICLKEGGIKSMDTPEKERFTFSLTDVQVRTLAEYGMKIHDHFKGPMDMEFAVEKGEVKLVQARPETVWSKLQIPTIYKMKDKPKKESQLVEGIAIARRAGRGNAKVYQNIEEALKDFKEGDIIVTKMTNPDWEPLMKKAGGIITEEGGSTCHAAIVSREFGVPCIVGAPLAMEKLKDRQVTIDCTEGIGYVWSGLLEYTAKEIDYHKDKILEKFLGVESLSKSGFPEKLKTDIMMNMSIPGAALSYAGYADGIGLTRIEFVLGQINIHPNVLVHYKELKKLSEKLDEVSLFTHSEPTTDKLLQKALDLKKEGIHKHDSLKEILKQVDEKIKGYTPKDYFVEKLKYGVATIATSTAPGDVIVRLSDFKTKEYRGLIGGQLFEEEEANPMLGWRGASRYASPDFEEAFRWECEAMREARKLAPNIVLMIPFVRTLDELRKVKQIMKEEELVREAEGGKDGLRIYMMAEVPSNVDPDLIPEWCKEVDGFSIGSNDLTQLITGVDRESKRLEQTGVFDEKNEAVLYGIRRLITIAHQYGKKVGICGEAPSRYPDFYPQKLVEFGIDSMSVGWDAFPKVVENVYAVENPEVMKKLYEKESPDVRYKTWLRSLLKNPDVMEDVMPKSLDKVHKAWLRNATKTKVERENFKTTIKLILKRQPDILQDVYNRKNVIPVPSYENWIEGKLENPKAMKEILLENPSIMRRVYEKEKSMDPKEVYNIWHTHMLKYGPIEVAPIAA